MTKKTEHDDIETTILPEIEATRRLGGIASDVLTWSGAELGINFEEGYHDIDYGTDLESEVEKLREELQIGVTEACLARLRDCGRGPLIIRAPVGLESDLRQWMYYALDFTPEDLATVKRYVPLQPAAPGDQRPRWLLIADTEGQTDRLKEMLTLAGAEVIHIHDPVRAAQPVSHEKLEGVLLRFNHRIDGEFIIADICMRRGIPFVIITNVLERPPSMSLGGVVVHNPRSMKEVIVALASLPPAKITGLTLPPPDPEHPQVQDGTDAPAA